MISAPKEGDPMAAQTRDTSVMSIRSSAWVLGLTSLSWSISLYAYGKYCFGVVHDCETESVEAAGWAVVLSIPFWLATLTISRSCRTATVLRILSTTYLVTLLFFSFSYVSSVLALWPRRESLYHLDAVCFLFLPYVLGLLSTFLLVRRIYLDFRLWRALPPPPPT
jgi:hypothetical protein